MNLFEIITLEKSTLKKTIEKSRYYLYLFTICLNSYYISTIRCEIKCLEK